MAVCRSVAIAESQYPSLVDTLMRASYFNWLRMYIQPSNSFSGWIVFPAPAGSKPIRITQSNLEMWCKAMISRSQAMSGWDEVPLGRISRSRAASSFSTA